MSVTPLGGASCPQSAQGLAWRRTSGDGLPAKAAHPLGHDAQEISLENKEPKYPRKRKGLYVQGDNEPTRHREKENAQRAPVRP